MAVAAKAGAAMAAAKAKMAAAGGGPDQGKRRTRRVSGTKVKKPSLVPEKFMETPTSGRRTESVIGGITPPTKRAILTSSATGLRGRRRWLRRSSCHC